MAAQCSRDQRLALADDIIDNSGPPEMLMAQVTRLDRFYRALANAR
jgi:dephospho-CoA kinase